MEGISIVSNIRMQTEPLDVQTLRSLLDFDKHDFLSQAYLHLLGRRIDPEGMQSYLNQLDAGATKASILYAIHVSREGVAHSGPLHAQIARQLIDLTLESSSHSDRTAVSLPALLRLEVADLVKTAFDLIARRPPYTDELEYFSKEASRGATKLRVLEQIVMALKEKNASASGVSRMEAALTEWRAGLYPTAKTLPDLMRFEDVSFVDCVYKTFLKRPADMHGLTTYVAQFRSGVSKLEIIRSIARSPEGRRQKAKLEGLNTATLRTALGRLWIIGRFFRMESAGAHYESSRRDLRAIHRALMRIQARQDEDAAAQDAVIRRVNDLLKETA